MAPETYRRTGTQRPKGQKTAPGKQSQGVSPEEKRRLQAIARAKRREEERRALEQKKERARLRKIRRKKLFLTSLSLALVFVVLYWAYVAFAISGRENGNEDALPLLLFTEGERDEDKSLTVEETSFAGKTFVPVTALEEYMVISQFGDYATRSFLLCESGEYATFYLNTCNAVINGVPVSLKNASFLKDDVLYLPVDFFTDKMNCFTFTVSSPLGANVLTFRESVTPSFVFRASLPSATVDAATIPVAPVVDPESQPTGNA